MQILAFDHFFDQDLSALEAALSPNESIARVDYQRLHRLARRYFPDEAFTGVAAAYRDNMGTCWNRYTARAEAVTDWLAAAHRPDVFVAPTDAIFYLRPVISRFRWLGIPTVVVQKETTISPMVMDRHAQNVRQYVPFMSAAMTVCSERQRHFWMKAGADPTRVVVTGQPRFDVYAEHRTNRGETLGRRLLYLSYDDVAYLPGDLGEAQTETWRALRRATEEALADAAARGWEVSVKHHPQQPNQPEWLGRDVHRHSQSADTRQLIGAADVVVGFQSTAMFEAAASGAAVLYCAWGPVFQAHVDGLIPFHEWPGVVHHVASAAELRRLLAAPEQLLARRNVDEHEIELHLGPVDGQASERTLGVIRRHLAHSPRAVTHRNRDLLEAAVKGLLGRALHAAGRSAAVSGSEVADRVGRLGHQWRSLGQEATAVRRGRSAHRRHLPSLGADNGAQGSTDDASVERQ